MNPVIQCLLNHKSIRKFEDTPIEPVKLDLIILFFCFSFFWFFLNL